MATKYWIKLWHELLHERKMAQLSDRLWRRAIECFLFAGELNDGGNLPALDDMAWTLHERPEILETELIELAKIGIVEQRSSGWFVTNFAKRQAKMDKAEYMRRLRDERQKEEYYQSGNETLPERYGERYRNVTNGNADTDTDTDKIRDRKEGEAPTDDELIPLVNALVDATGMSGHLNWSTLRKLAAALDAAEYTFADVDAGYCDNNSWWKSMDWRGKRGDRPTPKQIRETIKVASEWDGVKPSPNGQQGNAEPAGFAAIREIQEELANGNT